MSVKVYLPIDRSEAVNETAKRLMDMAEAHIRNAGYGGFSFRDLARLGRFDPRFCDFHRASD